MKKLLLLALLLAGLAAEMPIAEAAPCTSTSINRKPSGLNRTRRRLRRQVAIRLRRNKRDH